MIRIPHSCKVPVILAIGLFGGAAAQVDCGVPPAAPGTVLPVPVDLAGHLAPPPAAGQAACGAAATPSSGSSAPATGARAPGGSGQIPSLDGISTDVLHGLPAPDLLGPPAVPPERRDLE
ncbi:MAG: hypothetical protein P4L71_18155 [Acetobacteraceae bacterium]|nr:hypothetical protein [Acetobacteraceae bacterium]